MGQTSPQTDLDPPPPHPLSLRHQRHQQLHLPLARATGLRLTLETIPHNHCVDNNDVNHLEKECEVPLVGLGARHTQGAFHISNVTPAHIPVVLYTVIDSVHVHFPRYLLLASLHCVGSWFECARQKPHQVGVKPCDTGDLGGSIATKCKLALRPDLGRRLFILFPLDRWRLTTSCPHGPRRVHTLLEEARKQTNGNEVQVHVQMIPHSSPTGLHARKCVSWGCCALPL